MLYETQESKKGRTTSVRIILRRKDSGHRQIVDFRKIPVKEDIHISQTCIYFLIIALRKTRLPLIYAVLEGKLHMFIIYLIDSSNN